MSPIVPSPRRRLDSRDRGGNEWRETRATGRSSVLSTLTFERAHGDDLQMGLGRTSHGDGRRVERGRRLVGRFLEILLGQILDLLPPLVASLNMHFLARPAGDDADSDEGRRDTEMHASRPATYV
jgi:hypothetical protein